MLAKRKREMFHGGKRPNKNFAHCWGDIIQPRLRTVNDSLLFTLHSLGGSKMPGSLRAHENLGTKAAGVQKPL